MALSFGLILLLMNPFAESDEEDNFFALRPPTDLRNSDLYKSLASAATMQDDDDGFSDIDDMLNPKGQGHGVRLVIVTYV